MKPGAREAQDLLELSPEPLLAFENMKTGRAVTPSATNLHLPFPAGWGTVESSAFSWRLFIRLRRAAPQETNTEEQEQFERMQEALSQNGSPGGGRAKWKCRQKEPTGEQVGPSFSKENECLPSGKKAISLPGRRNQSKMKRNLSKNQCFKNIYSCFREKVLETLRGSQVALI